jgi:hypothetical protein
MRLPQSSIRDRTTFPKQTSNCRPSNPPCRICPNCSLDISQAGLSGSRLHGQGVGRTDVVLPGGRAHAYVVSAVVVGLAGRTGTRTSGKICRVVGAHETAATAFPDIEGKLGTAERNGEITTVHRRIGRRVGDHEAVLIGLVSGPVEDGAVPRGPLGTRKGSDVGCVVAGVVGAVRVPAFAAGDVRVVDVVPIGIASGDLAEEAGAGFCGVGQRARIVARAAMGQGVENLLAAVGVAAVAIAPVDVARLDLARAAGAGFDGMGQRTGDSATAAISKGIQCGLAAVGIVAIAIAPQRVAGSDVATTAGAIRRGVGPCTADAAAVAVRSCLQRGLTPVSLVSIAIAPKGIAALDQAGSRGAGLAGVSQATGIAAGPAVDQGCQSLLATVGMTTITVAPKGIARLHPAGAGGAGLGGMGQTAGDSAAAAVAQGGQVGLATVGIVSVAIVPQRVAGLDCTGTGRTGSSGMSPAAGGVA